MQNSNKTLILTGGSSGIGKAAVELFTAKGYKVYELSRHGESNGSITHIHCDVTDPAQCKSAVEQVIKTDGRIDVLVSNAGMGISGAVEFTTLEEARRQFDVNFFGSLNIAQAAIPYMRNQRGGTIIFVTSLMGLFSLPFQAFYSATKSALNSLALAMRNELRPFGVKVTCLLPGDVKTGFTDARNKSMEGMDFYPHMQKAVSTMEHDEQHGLSPESMAKELYRLAEMKNPPCFSTIGFMYHVFVLLQRLLPTSWANYIISKMY